MLSIVDDSLNSGYSKIRREGICYQYDIFDQEKRVLFLQVPSRGNLGWMGQLSLMVAIVWSVGE